jgi:hypothetical protein
LGISVKEDEMDGAFNIHEGVQKFMQTFGQETKE